METSRQDIRGAFLNGNDSSSNFHSTKTNRTILLPWLPACCTPALEPLTHITELLRLHAAATAFQKVSTVRSAYFLLPASILRHRWRSAALPQPGLAAILYHDAASPAAGRRLRDERSGPISSVDGADG